MQLDDKDLLRNKLSRKVSVPNRSQKKITEQAVVQIEEAALPSDLAANRIEKKDWIRLLDVCFTGVLYALVFLLPIFFLPLTTDVLELNKQMLLVDGVSLLAIIGGVRMLLSGTFELRLSSVFAGLFAVIVSWLLSSALSHYPYNSFVGIDRQEYISFLTIASLGVLLVIMAHGAKERVHHLLAIIVASSALASLFGLLQLFRKFFLPWDFTKTNAFMLLGTVDTWGVVAVVALLLSVSLIGFLSFSQYQYKMHASIALALSTGIQLISLSLLDDWRLWAGVISGISLLLVVLFIKLRDHKSLPWLVLPSFVLVLSLAFSFIHLPRVVDLPLTVQPTWKTGALIALDTLKASPLWGFGPGSFLESYTQFRPQEINNVNYLGLWNTRFNQASALFFTLAASVGILGILAILSLLVLLGMKMTEYLSSRSFNDEYLLFLSIGASLFALVVLSLFKPGGMVIFTVGALLAGLALVFIPKQSIVYNSDNSNRFLILSSVLLSVACIATLLTGSVSAQRYSAELAYGSALFLDQRLAQKVAIGEKLTLDDAEVLIGKLAVAVQRNPSVDTYYRTLSQAILYKVEYIARSSQDVGALQVATESMLNAAKKAVELNPADVRNYENLAQTYRKIIAYTGGADSFALEAFKKAAALDPQNPSLPLQVARVLLDVAGLQLTRANTEENAQKKSALSESAKKLFMDAEQSLEKATALKGDLPYTAYYLALIRIQQGNTKEALDLLMKAREQNALLVSVRSADPELFTLIATALASLGENDKALAAVRAGLTLRPDDIQSLWIFANLLSEMGKKDDAIAVLGKILQKDPKNEQVIKRIQELQSGAKEEKPTSNDSSTKQAEEPEEPEEKK